MDLAANFSSRFGRNHDEIHAFFKKRSDRLGLLSLIIFIFRTELINRIVPCGLCISLIIVVQKLSLTQLKSDKIIFMIKWFCSLGIDLESSSNVNTRADSNCRRSGK